MLGLCVTHFNVHICYWSDVDMDLKHRNLNPASVWTKLSTITWSITQFRFQTSMSFALCWSIDFVSAWTTNWSLWTKPQEVSDCHYKSPWQIHGCHCMWYRENGQRLHSVHEGATNWTRNISATGLCWGESCQWEAQVGTSCLLIVLQFYFHKLL